MSVYLRTLLDLYQPKYDVKRFLSSFFKTENKDIFEGRKIRIDIIRDNREYAVTIKYGSGSRKNTLLKWTGREFTPPAYHETTDITGYDLDTVMPGMSQYDLAQSYTEILGILAMNAIDGMANKIGRGIEIMCRDCLYYGKIILVNGDEIDFEVPTDHFYTTPVAWTASTADPFNDFGVIGDRVRRDSGRPIADAICGATALNKFKNNDNVKEAAQFRQMDRMSLESPVADPESGAVYHGTIDGSDYKINIWTFPESVRVPLGFNLSNEGTLVPIIPTDRIAVLPLNPNFKLYYAGNSVIKKLDESTKEKLGISAGPAMQAGQILKYAVLDELHEAVRTGVKSAPFPALVDKNELGVIIVT